MVGGALEYLALIVGFNALLLVVAVLYGLALLTGGSTSRRPRDLPSVVASPHDRAMSAPTAKPAAASHNTVGRTVQNRTRPSSRS